MRTCLALIVVALAAGSAGCASTNAGYSYGAGNKDVSYTYRQNTAYVQQVERLAARRGVSVEWVNPPYVKVRQATEPPARPYGDG